MTDTHQHPDASGDMLETRRLRLRRHRLEDFDASAALWADEAVTRFISGRPSTREEAWRRFLAYAGHWSLTGYGMWVVEEKATGAYAGEIGFADFKRDQVPPLDAPAESGWVIAPSAQGKGYATEAVSAALAWADQRFRWFRTGCVIEPANAASIRVAYKCGYRDAGQARYKDQELLVFYRERPV
jgi:RimJ/RimL family protein N-acetyltransferase